MREDIKINDRALALEKQLIEKLELVFDTDVELDVYNLGLIYELDLDEEGTCKVVMTFTDTACSCAESLPIEIVARLKEIEGIEDVKVEVTWSPAWKITRISPQNNSILPEVFPFSFLRNPYNTVRRVLPRRSRI